MFDENRFNERIKVTINNLRNLAATKCVISKEVVEATKNNDQELMFALQAYSLLKNDKLLEKAIAPSLKVYDEELGEMFQQYAEAKRNEKTS